MVKRVAYAFILVMVMTLFGGFFGHLAAGQVGSGASSATVTVTAVPGFIYTPPSDGGRGRAPAAPAAPPGITDVSSLTTVNGVFTHRITILSADELSQLTIAKGTLGLTGDSFPLSEISIIPMAEPPYGPPEGAIIIGTVYDIGPDGATFDPPIFLTFTYKEHMIPPGIAEGDLAIAWGDNEAGEWVALEFWIVNPETNTITGLVRHFTPFAILAYIHPIAFATSEMLIIPTEVNTGETVNIITLVTNTSGQSGSYEVTLKINGVAEASSQVIIGAGDSALVDFSTTKDTAGTYLIDVNGLTGSFIVKERGEAPPTVTPPTVTPPTVTPPTPIPPITPTPFNWWIIAPIMAAVAVVGSLYFFLYRRRQYAAVVSPAGVEAPVAPPPPPKPISYPAAISKRGVITRLLASVATAIAGGVGFLLGKRGVITRLLAAVATAIAGGVGFLLGKRGVITRLLASVASATASGVGFLLGKRGVITRLLASVATATAGGVGFLLGKRGVITRIMASVATAITGWVRLLLSKWKTKKPR